MITVDKLQGMARDVGTVWEVEDQDDGVDVIVTISLDDENEMSFNWTINNNTRRLYLPIERVKALLSDDEVTK